MILQTAQCKYVASPCKVQYHVMMLREDYTRRLRQAQNLKPFRGRLLRSHPLCKRRKAPNVLIPTAIPCWWSSRVRCQYARRPTYILLYPLSSAPSDGLATCLRIVWGYLETVSMENQSRAYRWLQLHMNHSRYLCYTGSSQIH